MSPHTEPPAIAIGMASSTSLTSPEIVTAIDPALIGMAVVAPSTADAAVMPGRAS